VEPWLAPLSSFKHLSYHSMDDRWHSMPTLSVGMEADTAWTTCPTQWCAPRAVENGTRAPQGDDAPAAPRDAYAITKHFAY